MTTEITPIMIYTEATPNPSSLKFVVNKELLAEGIVEMTSLEEAHASPFAQMLFGLEGVQSVFISNGFVTITKPEHLEWQDLMIPIKEKIKSYLESDSPIFNEGFEATRPQYTNEIQEGDSELVIKIKDVLEKYVKPAVAMDGGSISFASFDEGILNVKLQGSCSGCPSSMVTLKQGIDGLMKRFVPEVIEVVAEDA